MWYNFKVFSRWVKIILLFIFIGVGTASAQILVRGVISTTDSVNRIGNVSVKNLTTQQGTVTNDSGFYKLLASSGNQLEYSKTGFDTKKIVFGGETVLNISLSVSENMLDELVVSASKSDQSLKNTSVSMEVIKPYLIDNKNPATAENTVDQIPGVQAVNGQVVIRSGSGWSYGTGSRVMVMLDGMPMLSGDAGQVQWSFLPVENIENIEVIKGASSVLFGSSALNGVINIKTSQPKRKPETKISTFYGFYGKAKDDGLNWNNGKIQSVYGIRAFHSQKIGGLNALTISLNGFKDDGYRMSDGDQRIRLGTQYRCLIPKINGHPVIAHAGINGNIQSGKSSSFLLWENDKLAYTALDSNVTKSNTFRMNIDPYLEIKRPGAKRWNHLLQGRYFRLSNKVEDNAAGSSNQSNFSDAWYGEYQISRAITKNLKLIGGLTANYAVSQSPLYQGNQTAANKAVYAQVNQKLGKWNLDGGVRVENYRLNDYKESKPVVRAGMSRELTKATFLRASFGQGYRFPTIAESYVLTSVGPIKIYPNQDLKSEKGWNAEIGVKQGLKIGKLNALLDVAAFWMEYERMMEFTFAQWEMPSLQNPLPVGFKSVNVSDARIRGIDISLAGNRRWKQAELKWLGGYTFSKAIATRPDEVFYIDSLGNELTFKNTSSNPEGNYLKYRPKHLIRLDLQFEYKTWEAGVSLRYNSYLQNIDKAFVSFPIANAVPGVQTWRDKGKQGDNIIDLRVGKTSKTFKILLLVNNLLNRQYMTRPCDMRPPRSIMLQVNHQF
jgi:iron complex outermembrane receptor protein